MTDDTSPPPTPSFNWQAYEARERERVRLAAEALPANKTALFDAIAAAAITFVTVRFDGCGDSGQIEEVDCRSGDTAAALPEKTIEYREPKDDFSGLKHLTLPVSEVVESMVYALLEETHAGWGDNEGAYGEFLFDVAGRTITLQYNERISDTEYSEHEF